MSLPAEVSDLKHSYGRRPALQGISFDVRPAEIFGLLGPNGGGKTTAFRILSTLMRPSSGEALIFGIDVVAQPSAVRGRIGVVFQSPSLDAKLTVAENLKHQGHLYGMRGTALNRRIAEVMEELNLGDRARDRTEKLSGGLQRRVELAKGMLHRPGLLLLDEPGTGLDPVARRDLRQTLDRLRLEHDVTVLMTTHIMEEADHCDRVAILDAGRLVCLDAPGALKAALGDDSIIIETGDADGLCSSIQERFGGDPHVVDGTVRIERNAGHRFVGELADAFPGRFDAVSVGRPTLEDVFVQKTGHGFEASETGDFS